MENRISNLLWVMVGLVAVVAAISIILSFIFGLGGSTGTYGPFGMMGYGYYGMGFVMPIIGAVSVIFVIVFIYFLIESARGNERPDTVHSGKTPEDIARERLARGEITGEEFSDIMEQLKR